MQAKQGPSNTDWHQSVLSELLQSPLADTRVGPAFTKIGELLKFDLSVFPATTAKKLFYSQVKRELQCFLRGQTSMKDLHEAGVTIWDADMERAGRNDIGPIYGWQWRHWGACRIDEIREGTHQGFDQLRWAVNELVKTKGTTRRAIVSAWNGPEVLGPAAVLPPCHILFQFNVLGGILYTDVFQRSADAFLGLPFDVASFATLSQLVTNELKTELGHKFITGQQLNYHIANLHLYKEHEGASMQELWNDPSGEKPWLECYDGIDTFQHTACILRDYNESRVIPAKLLT